MQQEFIYTVKQSPLKAGARVRVPYALPFLDRTKSLNDAIFLRVSCKINFFWKAILSLIFLSQSCGAMEIDLSRSPYYREIATMEGNETLSAFRNSLGDALALNWKASESGRPGSCSQEVFARWVDLYQWLDFLMSDENTVMKRWLSRHLRLEQQQTLQGNNLQITLLQSGMPLNHEPVSPELLEKVLADGPMMSQIMGKLVTPPFSMGKGLLSDRLTPDFIAATLSDPDFLKRWSECVSQDDVAPKVLLILQSIWKSHRADWHDFQSLALALAVVKDQPAPEYWPHHQVVPADVPRGEDPPEELFAQWVDAFRNGKLRMDPRQLEAANLKFVIDAPLKYTEFASIRGNPTLAYLTPPKAFESIKYDQGRVARNTYDWSWGPYLLSSIKARGGICVDQAYYGAIAGKALGIPTIFFSGQGKDGGHAWIGYLKGSGQWDFNVARYASENYATGQALDPQGWTPITDHDLDLLTLHLGSASYLDAARRDQVIAADFRRKEDVVSEGRALQSALVACPENPTFWDAREEWLIRSGASLNELKSHHQAAISQFSRFNDLKAQHEQSLIELALRSGEKKDAQQLAERIANENRSGWSRDAHSDVSARAVWTLIAAHLQSSDYTGAVEEFERQLRLLGAGGGGDFFYMVVAPLSSQLIKVGHKTDALRVLKESYFTLKPSHDSILDHDLKKIWDLAGGPTSSSYLPSY